MDKLKIEQLITQRDQLKIRFADSQAQFQIQIQKLDEIIEKLVSSNELNLN